MYVRAVGPRRPVVLESLSLLCFALFTDDAQHLDSQQCVPQLNAHVEPTVYAGKTNM